MCNMIRSSGLNLILLLALVLVAANCGDESEVIIQELDCPALEGFAGGSYTFVINRVNDACTDGVIVGQYIQPGDSFGPVDLPGVDELPTTVLIQNIPLVGNISVQISSDGKSLRIAETGPIVVTIPNLGQVTATVSGVLCPVSETRVDGQITVKITSAPLISTPCNVRVQATGSLL